MSSRAAISSVKRMFKVFAIDTPFLVDCLRALHNYLNFPFPGLPQNEGIGSINQRIPPNLFGGMIRQKKPSK
jgi:hypothetical protein